MPSVSSCFRPLLCGIPLCWGFPGYLLDPEGFTPYDGGIVTYHNSLLLVLLIPVMIAGALPFKLYFLILENRRLSLFGDEQVKVFFVILALGTAVLTWDLIFFSDLP